MRRREFIVLIGGAAVGWPLVVRAQESGRTYRLGVFIPSARESPQAAAFLDELRLNGFVEGQNLTVIWADLGVSNNDALCGTRGSAGQGSARCNCSWPRASDPRPSGD